MADKKDTKSKLTRFTAQAFVWLFVVAAFATFGACLDYYIWQRTTRVFEIHVKPTLVTSQDPSLDELAEVGYGVTGTLFERAEKDVPTKMNPNLIRYRKGDWMPTTGPIHVFVFVGLVVGCIVGFIIIVGVNTHEEHPLIHYINLCHAYGSNSKQCSEFIGQLGSENRGRCYQFKRLFDMREKLIGGHGEFRIDEAPGWTYEVARKPTVSSKSAGEQEEDPR